MSNETNFELPAPEVFGPQSEHVVALLDRARHLTPDEASALADAWDNAWDNARDAAWYVAWDAAWCDGLDDGLGDGLDDARDAVRDTVLALVVRDLITADCYDTLTWPWREAIGPIHPEDEFWAAVAKAAK